MFKLLKKRANKETTISPWVKDFCEAAGNEFFIEVDEGFIQNPYQLAWLREQDLHYKEGLGIMLGAQTNKELTKNPNNDIYQKTAKKLYGLIHARYILTQRGMTKFIEKYKKGDFGYCPKVFCEEQRMIAIGLFDVPGKGKVNLFCPKCEDIFIPTNFLHQDIDSAYFGTRFRYILFLVHPELKPQPPSKQFTSQTIVGEKEKQSCCTE